MGRHLDRWSEGHFSSFNYSLITEFGTATSCRFSATRNPAKSPSRSGVCRSFRAALREGRSVCVGATANDSIQRPINGEFLALCRPCCFWVQLFHLHHFGWGWGGGKGGGVARWGVTGPDCSGSA